MSVAIEVKDVKIRYRSIARTSLKSLLFKKESLTEYFEAIHGISFSVEEGKIVGIIGKNGSGKSTLLRALANIFSPDEGIIDLHGHSVSLLALGVGFDKSLTGRENIMLSGMLMGKDKKEINDKMDEIISFADIGSFIDKPVDTYSSGMNSKLAFSITSTLTSDIILIDEVLSVGDSHFKKKSFKKMKELISDEKRTVLIVSHNLESIRKLCDEVIWIHDGKIRMQSNTETVLQAYEEYMNG